MKKQPNRLSKRAGVDDSVAYKQQRWYRTLC